MRTKPIPQAYRAFFRQIGLDPDVRRIPCEEVAVARLVQGGFPPSTSSPTPASWPSIETGVPVWALDADRVDDAGLGIRPSTADRQPRSVGRRRSRRRRCAAVRATRCPGAPSTSRTRRVTLFAVAVDGVPEIHVEEALWCAVELLAHPAG